MTCIDFSECSRVALVKMITKIPKTEKKSAKIYTADEVDTIRGINVARRQKTISKNKFHYLMLLNRLEQRVSHYEYYNPSKVSELKKRIDKIKKII